MEHFTNFVLCWVAVLVRISSKSVYWLTNKQTKSNSDPPLYMFVHLHWKIYLHDAARTFLLMVSEGVDEVMRRQVGFQVSLPMWLRVIDPSDTWGQIQQQSVSQTEYLLPIITALSEPKYKIYSPINEWQGGMQKLCSGY